ncbi:MAG: hypothetical protein ACTSR6_06465 [Candidatus Heimdallarchaeota archaeon]
MGGKDVRIRFPGKVDGKGSILLWLGIFLTITLVLTSTLSTTHSFGNQMTSILSENDKDCVSVLTSKEIFSHGYSMLPQAETPSINWDNLTIVDSPFQPITPSVVVDSFSRTHIFWSNYENGRSLYHQLIYENGTYAPLDLLDSRTINYEFRLDAVADDIGRVHLAFCWGLTQDSSHTYYQYWYNSTWSDTERIDPGVDGQGHALPSHNPQITIDQYNTPHIIWSASTQSARIEDITGYSTFYQMRLGEDSWSDILFIGYAKPYNYKIAITNDDTIHVIQSQRLGEIYYVLHRIRYYDKQIGETSWGLEETIGQEEMDGGKTYVPGPEILAVNDTIHIFINSIDEITGPHIVYLNKTGLTWSGVSILTSEASDIGLNILEAAATPRGDIILTYPNNQYDGTYRGGIHVMIYDTLLGCWTNASLITNNFTTAFAPSVAYDKNTDEIHVLWRDNHPVSGQAAYYINGIFDTDHDDLSNLEELSVYFTDPIDPDSDDDLLLDGDEILYGLDPFDPDEDSDLILDGWEISYGLNPHNVTDASDDFEPDGLTNLEEFTYGSDPYLSDTDSDSLTDGDEVNIHGTHPNNPDTDDDQLTDGDEILIHGTNATNPDSEYDGMPDGYEIANSLNPLFNDSGLDPDVDSITNLGEYGYGTNPNLNDTDTDNLDDFEEIFVYFSNPLTNDTDFDLLDDYYEVMIDPLDDQYLQNNTFQTDPNLWDTDGDQLSDHNEIAISGTNPLMNDTDGDLMLDGYEVIYNLNPFFDDASLNYDTDELTNYEEFLYNGDPFDSDTDDDRLLDSEEVFWGTDLNLDDTDGDYLTDYNEIIIYGTNATNWDTDFDGLSDSLEVFNFGTSPFDPDTDNDSLTDGDEIFLYGSHPLRVDSDFDGLIDPLEIVFGSAPYLADTDSDGMDDYFEYVYNFNPLYDDSRDDLDGDGLVNVAEYWYFSDPTVNDTDGDLLNDADEVYLYLSSPIKVDTDDDGLTDFQEAIVYNTSPNDPDMDDDGLLDGEEIMIYNTDPDRYDTDNDGYSDFEEIEEGTNPLNPSSNPGKRLLTILASVFSGTVGILFVYYVIPYLFNLRRKNEEQKWIRIGLQKRQERSDKMLSSIEKSSK